MQDAPMGRTRYMQENRKMRHQPTLATGGYLAVHLHLDPSRLMHPGEDTAR